MQELLYEGSWQEQLGRFRSNLVFRGQQDAASDLSTSLARLGGDFARLERHLLRNFRKYAHSDIRNETFWDWLALAKHHGLPTRLLDWTYSPYVAMHFATHDFRHFDEDAAIWCVDYRKMSDTLPRQLREVLKNEDVNIFTTELLNRVATTLEQFDDLSKDDFVVFFEPPSLDERIVNQFALFSLPSSPSLRLQSLLEQREGSYRRIVIPAALKWEIRDKLDQANITERVLFPGLDGLSQWLKRYFTTRKP